MTDGQKPEPIDPRVERSKQKVLQETYRLMTEGGLAGFSVDEVSRRSGVSKTTIYRHWPSRSTLLLDACSRLGSAFEAPDTGDVGNDLRVLARRLAADLTTGGWATILPSIVDAAERDPAVAELLTTLNAGFMAPFRSCLERAISRGGLSAGIIVDEIVASIAGPLFYRRWHSKEPLDEGFVDAVVGRALGSTPSLLTEADK